MLPLGTVGHEGSKDGNLLIAGLITARLWLIGMEQSFEPGQFLGPVEGLDMPSLRHALVGLANEPLACPCDVQGENPRRQRSKGNGVEAAGRVRSQEAFPIPARFAFGGLSASAFACGNAETMAFWIASAVASNPTALMISPVCSGVRSG